MPVIGDRVSVSSKHFGDEYEKHFIGDKIFGTVKFKLSGKARIQWDIDKEYSDVLFDKLTIEANDCPEQSGNSFFNTY